MKIHLRLPVCIGVLLSLSTVSASAAGFKNWQFGMSRAQVMGVGDCSPYTPVRSTGGLECRNFSFLGARINISFIFGASGLSKIQVWAYQGRDQTSALNRWTALIKHLKQRYGALTSPQLPTIGQMSRGQLQQLLRSMQSAGRPGKYQFKPAQNPRHAFVFNSMFYHPQHGFFLFLYFQPPRP